MTVCQTLRIPAELVRSVHLDITHGMTLTVCLRTSSGTIIAREDGQAVAASVHVPLA